MRGIGLNFQKGRIRVTVMDANDGTIEFVFSQAITIDPEMPTPELMDRYASHFRLLIDEHKPDIVAARQVYDSDSVSAATCQIAPFAIAAYICNEKNIQFSSFTPQALRQPKRFNLDKGADTLKAVDSTFGQHPPYWDDMQRGSLLAIWRALLEQEK